MPVRGNLVAGLSAADSNRAVLGGKFDRRACGARPGAAGGSVFLALDVCAFAAAPARLAASETRLAGRSEEHTSELQSLMRISYDAFCLQKQPHTTPTTSSPTI